MLGFSILIFDLVDGWMGGWMIGSMDGLLVRCRFVVDYLSCYNSAFWEEGSEGRVGFRLYLYL